MIVSAKYSVYGCAGGQGWGEGEGKEKKKGAKGRGGGQVKTNQQKKKKKTATSTSSGHSDELNKKEQPEEATQHLLGDREKDCVACTSAKKSEESKPKNKNRSKGEEKKNGIAARLSARCGRS